MNKLIISALTDEEKRVFLTLYGWSLWPNRASLDLWANDNDTDFYGVKAYYSLDDAYKNQLRHLA